MLKKIFPCLFKSKPTPQPETITPIQETPKPEVQMPLPSNFFNAKQIPTRAVIVAINKYDNGGANDLRGCVEDGNAFQSFLTKLGTLHISRLNDYLATDRNITVNLNKMLDESVEGDICVFYYSGHGSTIPNKNSATDTEIDGEDQVICCTNFFKGGMLIDDWLFELSKKFEAKKVKFSLVMDCCHSATNSRAVFSLGQDDETLMKKKRSIDWEEIPLGSQQALTMNLELYKKHKDVILKKNDNANYVFKFRQHWAGCEDTGTSQELRIGNSVRGVFTYYLLEELYKNNFQVKKLKENVQSKIDLKIGKGAQNINLESPTPNSDLFLQIKL